MPDLQLKRGQEEALQRLQEKFEQIKSEINELGFVVQGSVTERWMKCGKSSCHCQKVPDERHGPYYQWSWKSSGHTSSVNLTKEQAVLCKQWVKNNRRLEKITKRLRKLSLRVARLYKIAPK